MIYEEDIEMLSGLSPDEAFYKFEKIARKRLEEQESLCLNSREIPRYTLRDYVLNVIAAAEAFRIEELAAFELPHVCNPEAEAYYESFRANAIRVSTRLMLQKSSLASSVSLDQATKKKLSHFLKKMRETVNASNISDEKKDRLFRLIDDLQHEIDRERTPLHAAGELWQTLCTYVASGAASLEPAVEMVERIGAALGIAREEQGSKPMLPPRKEPKRIEPPKKRTSDIDLKDEIPF